MESLLPKSAWAAANAGPPLRMGIFTVTGGTVLESWKPKEVGRSSKLPSILRPLERAKDDLLVLSGLSHGGRSEDLNGHEHCAFKHLTGRRVRQKVRPARPTPASRSTRPPPRVVGDRRSCRRWRSGCNHADRRTRSARPTSRVPYEGNPRLVFERMFRGRKPVVPNWASRGQRPSRRSPALGAGRLDDRSVVDLVLDEAKDLRRKLGHGRPRQARRVPGLGALDREADRLHRGPPAARAGRRADPGPSKLEPAHDLPPKGPPIWKITPAGRSRPGASTPSTSGSWPT